jgi:hypothetical protein
VSRSMTRMLAARLSRAVVGCYPRRWRQRYASELLDVLDQHRAGARTVLNLAASAVSTHLDPAYRSEGLAMTRLRRAALISAAVVVPIALSAVALGLFVAAQDWKDSHWHVGIEGGVDAMAFSPDQRIHLAPRDHRPRSHYVLGTGHERRQPLCQHHGGGSQRQPAVLPGHHWIDFLFRGAGSAPRQPAVAARVVVHRRLSTSNGPVCDEAFVPWSRMTTR